MQFYFENIAYFNGSDGLGETAEVYEPKMGASIEGGLLYLTFTMHVNGQHVKTLLGDAEYRVFNRAGALVSGLSQTGISANAEGIFVASPISATSLLDLNHYEFEVTINYQGIDRVAMIKAGVVE